MGWALRALVFVGAVVVAPLPAQTTPVRVSPPQLPLVLFIHGRGQKNRADQEIRVEWLMGFREGQRGIGALDLIPTSAIAFTFYQHAFEKPPDPAVATPTACADAVASAEKKEAVLIREDDSLARVTSPAFHTHSPENAAVQAARDALTIVSAEFLLRAFTATFGRDTHDWLERGKEYDATRCVLNLAFAHAGTRPIIVVAHSMGTLAVYDYLYNPHRGDATPNIVRFITLGSQLGNEAMIRRLDTSGRVRNFHYPPHVGAWINLHDYEDFITYPLTWDGRPAFEAGGNDWNRLPLDLGINDISSYHHQIGAYLSHPYTARAIAAGWCEAARSSGTEASTACERYSPRDMIFERDEVWKKSIPKRFEQVAKFALLSGSGAYIGHELAEHNNWPRGRTAWMGAFFGAAYAWYRDSGVR
ncbi:MAG TPA: hypothetical protein VKB91_06580 [Gemmatimonadaceae bacterium]|nr:hypothetical protein [Gemmatimonadaceae bacterium]